MNWTGPREIKAQLSRLWERGDLLRSVDDPAAAFPLRLSLRGPGSNDLADRFQEVRAWVDRLVATPRVRLQWREVNHRVQGAQRLPEAAWMDNLDDALALLGRQAEARGFESLVALTRARNPALLPWLHKRPLQGLVLRESWSRLLDIVAWVQAHPRPGVFLRQVDIPGVHSKFIEAHRATLAELLDLVLHEGSTESAQRGTARFAARYGFRDKPTRIRFRVLDPTLALLPGAPSPDVTLDELSFSRLELQVERVFITENEVNFLALPPVSGAIVVFGAGYGWDALARAQWLSRTELHYWGDIDTHGFAILDQLRRRFPQVVSFLMDRDTLFSHEALWGSEPEQVTHNLAGLTPAEANLYDELRDNRIRANLRLEQEMIGFTRVAGALDEIVAGAFRG